jgi:hypothetical protein
MQQTHELRGRLGLIEDMAFLAIQAFMAGDDAGLVDALNQVGNAAAAALEMVAPRPKN